jgi:zinc protease
MNSYTKLLILFLSVCYAFNSKADNQFINNEDSITKDPIVVNSNYYMISNMTGNLPVDPNIKIDTLPGNKLVYYVKKNYEKNAETIIELVYKVGSLMEDSTKRAYSFFTANYVAKYYASVISNKFNGKINPKIDVESKPDYTRFIFSVVTTEMDRNTAIADFLKVLSDSISFNSQLLDANRADFITQYNQTQLDELQYRGGKQLKIKYLNTISAAKLKQFYKDWYRPDLTSIMVVGDIDVQQIQQSITTNFTSLKNPLKEKPVIYHGVPKKPTLQLTIVDDSTQTEYSSVQFYFKKFRNNRTSYAGYVETAIGIISALAINKVSEDFIKEKNISDYSVKISFETFTKNEDAFVFNVVGKKEFVDLLVVRFLDLGEDVKNGGFFKDKPLNLAKMTYLNKLKNQRDSIETSADMAITYLNHFVYNLPLIGKKQEYEFANSIVDKFVTSNFTSFLESAFEQNNITIVLKRPVNSIYTYNNKKELLIRYNESLLTK